jgi:hypothetical protein
MGTRATSDHGHADDRRTAFRITEQVLFTCVPLSRDTDPAQPVQGLFDADHGELDARLAELDQGYRECHARLARIDATVAEACDWLSAKLDLIYDALHAQRAAAANGLQRTTASLGITGVGFPYATALPVGQRIALYIIYGTHQESLQAYATVRQCQTRAGENMIGAEFDELSSEQHRRLSRHILQAQIKAKKQ